MQTPNSYTRHVALARTVEVAGMALDLYAPPVGPGWQTPADPVFDLAGIPETDRLDILPRIGITRGHGFEIVWTHPTHVTLLTRNAVAGVLANAVTSVEPATAAAIDAALAG